MLPAMVRALAQLVVDCCDHIGRSGHPLQRRGKELVYDAETRRTMWMDLADAHKALGDLLRAYRDAAAHRDKDQRVEPTQEETT